MISALIAAALAASAGEVSRAELTTTVDRLALLDRISGSEGEREANAYLKQKLTEYGIPFDSYEMELYLSHPMSASVTVLTPESAKLEAINHAFSHSTPAGGIEGELVYIGRNMTADPFDAPLVDYDALDVKGKIVLDDGFPAPYRAFATEKAGALAQIYINPDDRLHNMTVTTIWGAPTPETASHLPRNPIRATRGSAIPQRGAHPHQPTAELRLLQPQRSLRPGPERADSAISRPGDRLRARASRPRKRRGPVSRGPSQAGGEPHRGGLSRGPGDRRSVERSASSLRMTNARTRR